LGTAKNCEFSTNNDLSKASFLWLAGETLPKQFWGEVGPLEFVLDEAKKILDRKFLSGAHIALNALEKMLGSGTKKARRLLRVINEMSAAVESSGHAVIDAAMRHSSTSSGADPTAVAEEESEETVAIKLKALMFALDYVSDGSVKDSKWPEFAAWICESEMPCRPLLPLRPGLGSPAMPTIDALRLVRDQLLYKALYESHSVEAVRIRTGTVIPETGKKATKICLPRMPHTNWKGSSKHWLAWVCGIDTLDKVINSGDCHDKACGSLRFAVHEEYNSWEQRYLFV
jgi:hypothetical protein